MRFARLAVALASAVLTSQALAETPPPLPPEVTKVVDTLVGNWVFDTTVKEPGKDPITFKDKLFCKKVAGGRGVLCAETAKVPGTGAMEGSHLIAYDVERKAIHWFVVASSGEVHDHVVRWQDDKTLVAEPLNTTMDSQSVTENFSLAFDAKKAIYHGVTTTPRGDIVVDGTAKR